MSSLFTTIEDDNSEQYKNLASSDHPTAHKTRDFLDTLWDTYKDFSDTNFEQEFKIDFNSRYWEMYLTCLLLEHGKPVKCLKPGPDILIEQDSKIWIEAIAPTAGDENLPDSVPPIQYGGVAQDHPSEQIILRYRSAIREKFENKYKKYLDNGTLNENDSYIIAISSCKIDIASLHPPIPEIIKSVFPIGHQQIHFSQKDGSVVGNDFQYKDFVEKESGNPVSTDLFFDDNYCKISGILYSSATSVNNHNLSGEEIIFIHNPNAQNPIPHGFFNFGKEYIAIPHEQHFELSEINHNS